MGLPRSRDPLKYLRTIMFNDNFLLSDHFTVVEYKNGALIRGEGIYEGKKFTFSLFVP